MINKKNIVISGANITSGGPLKIFKETLTTLAENYPGYKVVAIVSDIGLYDKFTNVEFVEFKLYKKVILLKFYYEYYLFNKLSKLYNADLWLSLNDCSPTVHAKIRAVYCHNAAIFYKGGFKDFLKPTRMFMQSIYYSYFYKKNIQCNNFLIVQQAWLRSYFSEKYSVSKHKIIVNRPVASNKERVNSTLSNEKYLFIYPTKPEPYKNIEIIIKACAILKDMVIKPFEIVLTFKSSDNKHARHIEKLVSSLGCINFVGTLTQDVLQQYYNNADCLLFPSTVESWGLPITEFQEQGRPILVADLPYAKETVGDYDKALFFNPNDEQQLAGYMKNLINHENISFDKTSKTIYQKPFAENLNELFNILLGPVSGVK